MLAALVSAPIVAYAVVCSLAWFGAPFPGFLLMQNAVVPTVSGFDWPLDRGDLFHSQVMAVDGHPVESSAAVYAYVAARPAGTVVLAIARQHVGRFQQWRPVDLRKALLVLFRVGHAVGQVGVHRGVVTLQQQGLWQAPQCGKEAVEGPDAAVHVAHEDAVRR